jgi:hypothetical protein
MRGTGCLERGCAQPNPPSLHGGVLLPLHAPDELQRIRVEEANSSYDLLSNGALCPRHRLLEWYFSKDRESPPGCHKSQMEADWREFVEIQEKERQSIAALPWEEGE